jgi:hypothetical protein
MLVDPIHAQGFGSPIAPIITTLNDTSTMFLTSFRFHASFLALPSGTGTLSTTFETGVPLAMRVVSERCSRLEIVAVQVIGEIPH